MTLAPPQLNFPNIQGDIILGIPKKVEEYVFFQITNVALFRKQLKHLVPLITTMAQVIDFEAQIAAHKKGIAAGTIAVGDLIPFAGTNVAFSDIGLQKFGITDGLGDAIFAAGQAKDAASLGDIIDPKGNPVWDSTFLQPQGLDGVLLVTGESELGLQTRKLAVEALLAGSIKIIDTLAGNVRPGVESGHEHFGFQDGISQPAIIGFGTPNKGQEAVGSGVILVGGLNDPVSPRPSTVGTDGSFLAFRKLKQYVPEFDAFLVKNGTGFDGLTPREGADFLGARLVGRWKSGAPIDLAPVQDNLTIAKDPQQNNNFSYTLTNPDDHTDQTRCPFSAHIRKTNPRGDLEPSIPVAPFRIIRQGIPYGPEVTAEERSKATTLNERGLAFVCYQSSLSHGFHFLQETWANNVDFHITGVGEDPIIGVNTQGPTRTRSVFGFDPKNQTAPLTMNKDFIESRGGEYFFSPSIATLRDVIGTN